MRKIIVKEGPLVFLRNVLLMEVIAGLFIYAISYLQNYEMLYHGSALAKLIRYDIFLVVTFSSFQLIYVSLLFLDWYFSHFEITDREITKKSGLLFRHRKSVGLSSVVSVETYNSPLGRLMHHATIVLHHDTNRVTKIKNVAHVDDYVHIIKQLSHKSTGEEARLNASYFIRNGEGRHTEFKETLRVDTHTNTINKELERMVIKTIVAFLNTDGGTLLIGVKDDRSIIGIERDFETLPKKSTDGFENHLSMLIKSMIGLPFTKYVNIKFEVIENKEVCLVHVGESHKPAYLRGSDKKEEFFVRVGNSTQPFSMSETEEYIKTHWK